MTEENGQKKEISELEKKIIRQIEYYFGDINLSRDRFLREEIKKDGGWIAMEIMVKFNRLKALSADHQVICDALRKSESGLIEVSEDNCKIRRSPLKPLPENTKERRNDLSERTAYAKGFPVDSNLDDLLSYFEEFGKIENMYMRKDMKKNFKGSVFVIFEKKEDVDKFLELPEVVYKEMVLQRYRKEDYFKKKTEERKLKKEEMHKMDQEQQLKKLEEEKQKLREKIVPGTILHLTGFAEDTQREDIKNFFEDYAKVAWIDYVKSHKEAWVRFKEKDQANVVLKTATEAGDGKLEINKAELTGDVLEGDAEFKHWQNIFHDRASKWEKKERKRRCSWGKKGGFVKRSHKVFADDESSEIEKPAKETNAAAAAGKNDDEEPEPPIPTPPPPPPPQEKPEDTKSSLTDNPDKDLKETEEPPVKKIKVEETKEPMDEVAQ